MRHMHKTKTNQAIHSVLDFKGFDDYVELFKAGQQIDSLGVARHFTAADLDSMVANHESFPIVIGHPKVDAPAYGWSAELKRDGDSLFGKFEHVESQFADMVQNKRFPNRSLRIKQTDNGYQVQHVGFLGAVAPAIPGLKQVEFAADDDAIEFEFSSYDKTIMARLLRRMREFLVEKFSIEDADKVMPEWELETLSESAIREQIEDQKTETFYNQDPNNTGGADVPKTYTQAELDAELAKQKSDFSTSETDLKSQLSTERKTRLTAEYSAFVNRQIDAGKLTPALAAGAVDFMLQMSADVEFEFSQGEGDKKAATKTSAVKWFQDFVGALPKTVSLGAADDEGLDGDRDHEYAAPAGAVVDADRLALHRKALDYMSKQNCDYVEAVVAVGA
jgi:hypothetical protein